MRPDVVPGGTFPDYELPDHTSRRRKLSELQGDDPLILTLARGHYCPKEHQQLRVELDRPRADRDHRVSEAAHRSSRFHG
jgi:peroxiredoxin